MKFNTLFIIGMFRKLLTFSLVLFGFGLLSQVVSASESEILVALNCDGTKVVRSLETGAFIVSHVASNLPSCIGSVVQKDRVVASTTVVSSGSVGSFDRVSMEHSNTGVDAEEKLSTGKVLT